MVSAGFCVLHVLIGLHFQTRPILAEFPCTVVTPDLDYSDYTSKYVLIQDLASTWHDSFDLDMVSFTL